MTDVVLCLGFDLFFKPKLSQAADAVGVRLVHARPEEAVARAADATRIVADVSTPGVAEALEAVLAAHPDLPLLACYPHVEAHRVAFVEGLNGKAVTRGAFAQRLPEALSGKWA